MKIRGEKIIVLIGLFLLLGFSGCLGKEVVVDNMISRAKGSNEKLGNIENGTESEANPEVVVRVKSVAIGDSITYGYPYGHKYSWVHFATKRLGTTIINSGEPGETTGEMLARFERDVIGVKPEYVIILGGTNDAFYNIPEGFVRNNIYKMAKMAQQAGIKPIIALPIPINEEPANTLLSKYRDWMREFARQNDYLIIDFYSITVDEKTGFIKQGFHEDGVHPSPLAYQEMSEIVKLE